MDKRVALKLHSGTLEAGFSATLQIGNEDQLPDIEISGSLPPAPALKALYHRWQAAYHQLGLPSRIADENSGFVTNVSIIGDCDTLSAELQTAFNNWLRAESFRPLHEKLLERLTATDTIRLLLQTPYDTVQRLPWHLWEICDRYPKLEIVLSAPTYQKAPTPKITPRPKIRILAILGHSHGLDIETDRALLNQLPHAEVHYLTTPTREALNTSLWDPTGWDILFFAGHSLSTPNTASLNPSDTERDRSRSVSAGNSATTSSTGQLSINPTTTLTTPQLKHALKHALTRGLKIAIFNSCDGIGLAKDLADLQIPQILVMRELVPDPVAHAFLKSFLQAYAQGAPLTLAVREAREKLQGIEDQYPCAAWLPTLYQTPTATAPAWQDLYQPSSAPNPTPSSNEQTPLPPISTRHALLIHGLVLALLLGLRSLGFFQTFELRVLDQLLRQRSPELPDSRIVIVTIDETDIRTQDPEDRRSSLSDSTLIEALNRLNPMEPQAIGIDIYRDFPVRANQPALAEAFAQQSNLFAICKGSDLPVSEEGIPPPPEFPISRIGFSDFPQDADTRVRRQLFSFDQELASPCKSTNAFNALLALNYLDEKGHTFTLLPNGDFQIGEVSFTPIDRNSGGYHNTNAEGYQFFLNYRNLKKPEQIAEEIKLSELLAGKVSPEDIRDRIVLIGVIANSATDDWPTPYGPTKGVYLQAHMISQFLSAVLDDRAFIHTWNDWQETLWILFWASTASLMILTLNSKHRISAKLSLGLLLSEIALLGLCWLLFSKAHTWVPWLPAAIAPIAIAQSTPLARYLNPPLNKSTEEEPS